MELYWGDEVVVWKGKLASMLETWPKVESSIWAMMSHDQRFN